MSLGPNFFSNTNEEISINFLESLVNTNSQTQNFNGVKYVQYEVERRLKDFGLRTFFIPSPQNAAQQLLIGALQGKSDKNITLICHADTAAPLKEKSNFKIQGKTAIGCGVADNKGGIYVGLKALEKVANSKKELNHTLYFVCSPNEEEGSIGFHNIFNELSAHSKFVFGLEPALSDGSIISSRNGNRWYEINFKGIKAHSGRLEGEFRNAAHDMISAMNSLFAFNKKYEGKAYFNISTIEGGDGIFNILCGHAKILLDLRFCDNSLRDEFHEMLVSELDQLDATFEIKDDCPGLSRGGSHSELIQGYTSVATDIEGEKVVDKHTGGAADVNYFAHEKNFCLDGLGPKGGNLHRSDEFVIVDSLESRAEALKDLILSADKTTS